MKNIAPIVLFDGLCNLCSFSVQFLATRDRESKLLYASIQSDTGQKILLQNSQPTDTYESFILVEEDRVYFKSTACLRLTGYMKWPWPLLRAVGIMPRFILDWLYDRIARNRYALFGSRSTCMRPRKDLADRFLS